MSGEPQTLEDPAPPGTVRGFRLTIVSPDRRGTTFESRAGRCTIGAHDGNDAQLADPRVSRFHCEVVADAAGGRLRDLGSTNGTFVDGVRVADGWLRDGSTLRVGATDLRFEHAAGRQRLPLSVNDRFGSLVGRSTAMREAFALLERAATSDSTVLLEGETGTGKSQAAEALHRAGARRDKPFVVVDCGAIPAALIESELFGHEKGAFTSAEARRIGAFEEADGGTLFLDELGELPLELQPKLLRAIEAREIRRVGASAPRSIDVRLVAGTNRDLRAEVNRGAFRADLYFRVAVLPVRLPPLRARPEDVPLLAAELLDRLRVPASSRLREPGFYAQLQRGAWAGNVRELRNHLERCLLYEEALAPAPSTEEPPAGADPGALLPFSEARDRALSAFERQYLERLLQLPGGRTQAARAAGINRVYLYRLLVRHGLK